MGQTPEPDWRSIEKDGSIELRDYEPMIVAEVTTSGERSAAINKGFRILAAYIFGDNSVRTAIEMTAPVTQQAETSRSQKISMTAPVTQSGTEVSDEWDVRFVMPKEYTIDTLPMPNDGRIRVLEIPGYRAAVIRFSGFNTDKNLASHEQKLMAWLENNNIKPDGKPVYAFYNPPWTPPFMKRNEVMIRVLK